MSKFFYKNYYKLKNHIGNLVILENDYNDKVVVLVLKYNLIYEDKNIFFVEFCSLNSENKQLKIGDKCDVFVEANKKLFNDCGWMEFDVRNIIK